MSCKTAAYECKMFNAKNRHVTVYKFDAINFYNDTKK